MQILALLALCAHAAFVQQPKLSRPAALPPRVVADVSLPPLLDRQRDLLRQRIGGDEWALGVAATRDLKTFFISFERPGVLLLAPLEKPGVLVKEGLVVEVEPDEFCAIKVDIGLLDLFNPMRCVTVRISGTGEAPRELPVGKLLELVEKRLFAFKAGRREYRLLYATDVDPETGRPAATRSVILLREDGLGSRAWAIPESELGRPLLADLGETKLGLSLAGGRLSVTAPR